MTAFDAYPDAVRFALGLFAAMRRLGVEADDIFFSRGQGLVGLSIGEVLFPTGPETPGIEALWHEAALKWKAPETSNEEREEVYQALLASCDHARLVVTVQAALRKLKKPATPTTET